MTDRTRSNGHPITDPTADRTGWVDIGTAATRLGMTSEAIRQRIKRGTLRAEKRGGRVYVAIDPTVTEPPTERQSDADPTEPIETAYRVDGMSPAATLVPVTALYDQAERMALHFADQLERLTREAMAAAAERDQLRTERDALAARLDALQTAQAHDVGPGGPEAGTQDLGHRAPQEGVARPWWAFWRRA